MTNEHTEVTRNYKPTHRWLFRNSDRKRSLFLSWLRNHVLSISPDEATFTRRGFRQHDKASREHLEQVGRCFLDGYHAALADERIEPLVNRLDGVEAEFRGFAFEGAAMGLCILDCLSPWKKDRLKSFLDGPGSNHIYMVHVGVGWALARLPWFMNRTLRTLDPLLGWLALDGYGFHEGFFHWGRYSTSLRTPRQLLGYEKRVFDQGLGRSLWFIEGADVRHIPLTIASFPETRQADLWSGVGLACAYAGGTQRQAMKNLSAAAGRYKPHLAQGAAFAAKARQRAKNPTPHTEMACELLCNMSAEAASDITDIALKALDHNGAEPSYEVWRRRIRTLLTH